ncbi:uncharacterized protein DSM5745_11398 [Aspergillus mulundensis]|uniref:ER transporter 6TM N-terminal domain-containing protein n=1 Tax=Aspergillus mulundensis TaxID=1810919 RepID=A0A3D8Q887_9EURO|nr:Uncharacterized protein DSM5745_11398 [Aspergillus mulundensis]RDW57880.1 Uncharacterized protein DSM5745_11398 [Aspergillus mulundensis]
MADRVLDKAGPGRQRRLPAFLDHFTPRDLKIFFRCWVAVWVASLLIFINPVASNFGQATFFACMVLFMLPPSGVLFVYILGSLSLFVGICLAWAWGVIALKAALAARPDADTQARLAALQQAAAAEAQETGESVSSIAQRLVYNGWMLDARVTSILFCMMCLFIYFMARLRAANPKTALTSIFGIIIADLFLCYGPVLPSFNGNLPLSLVKPAAAGVGLGVACSILFFPRSSSDIIREGMEDLLELLKSSLQFSHSSLGKSEDPDLKDLQNRRTKIIEQYRLLEPSFAFLPLDFHIGSWGPEAVGTFREPVRHLVAAILALADFHKGTAESRMYAQQLRESSIKDSESDLDEKKERKVGVHHRSQLAELVNQLQYTERHSINESIANQLTDLSGKAMETCLEGLSVISECVQFVGRQRWYHKAPPARHEELFQQTKTVLQDLQQTRTAFLAEMTQALLDAYGPALDNFNQGENNRAAHLAGIILCMNFQEHMSNAMDKTEVLLDRISSVFPHASRTRFFVPTSLKYAGRWLLGRKNKAPNMAPTSENLDDPNEAPEGDATQAAQEKLRVRRGYRPRARHPLGRAILGIYHWLTSDEGMFALRMVVVTIAVAISAVLPNTAGFFYRERGFWALIMAQTGLLVYMADFTFSVLARVIGTIAGGVLGLVAWYIGSGHGPGNPYGLSAAMAVLLVIFLWIRLYSPPVFLQGAIMSAATFLLVVAYSYVDTHTPAYGQPGVGYQVFWRRLLLVLIGIGAATIVQMLPRPPSAARHICNSLSRSLRTLSDHYALLLSCWGRAGDEGKTISEPIWLELTESLVLLEGPIFNLRFEFSSSRFDSASLGQVKQICHAINGLLSRLLVASASLPQSYKDRLASHMGMLDHRCIGEIMAVLGVAEQSLRTGDAPPEILPTPLVRRALEYSHAHHMDRPVLSAEMIRDEDYRRYCVALAAYVSFLGQIDGLVLVIKGVLGEAHLVSRELVDLV